VDQKNSAVPRNIVAAISLIAISLFGNILILIIRSEAANNLPTIEVLLVVSVISAFLYGIYCRKNWARMTFIIIFAAAVGRYIAVPSTLVELFSPSPVQGAISVTATLLRLAACCLLLTPAASAWFRKHPKNAPGTSPN
jgi:hypothetical protein